VEFLTQVCEQRPETIRIVLSGYADTAAVVEAINLGQIYKFIPKPWNDEELKSAISAALQHQNLQQQNNRLNEELQKKNRQLEEINENLEQLVAQRTEALEIRNRVLQIAQGVLDMLPVAVFGIDPEQMIVQCNDFARDLFPYGGIGPLGNDRREVFSAELNDLISRVETETSPRARVTVHTRAYRAEVRRLHVSLSQGVVLVLIPE
jgi:two-component system NtrC family sensor kinase